MKSLFTLTVTLLLATGGCGVKPAPGLAMVSLKVSAEPKKGAPDAAGATLNLGDYDSTPQLPGPMEQIDYSTLTGIIVWLEPANGKYDVPPPLKIDAKAPSSSVRPVTVGQWVMIENKTAAPVSPYSVSDGNEFNLPPIGWMQSVPAMIRSPGVVEILIDPGKPPLAVLYAVPSPWVAVARSGETVTFNNLPPGRYTAHAWHPRLPGSAVDLSLSADEVTQATVRVSVNNLAATP